MSEPPPRVPRRLGRRVWRGCVYTFAGMVLIGAVALIGLRLLLPELGRYESEIEAWVSRVAERPVEFGAIDAHWRGWTPVFRLREVRLFGRETPDAEPWIGLADLSFSIDPLESLRSGALQPRAIAARGASLVVVRRHDGSISVQETGSRSPAAPREWGGFLQWVLSRTNVSLSSSRILWVDERRDGPALPLSGVSLHLEQEDGRYLVSGAFELPEAGRIDVSADLDGESFTTSWSGTAYVAAHDVDLKHVGLAARPIGAEGVSGLLSGAVWSSWKDARLVQAEGSIRVESPGVVAQGSRRGFDEVSASAKIERTATGWALAVEDLVVTTAGGSWPSSRAAAWWAPPREGHDGAVVVNAQFARIEDLAALAFPSREPAGDDMSNALASAAPRGVIEDVRIYAPITDRIEIEHARARGRFTGLHVEAADWSAALEGASGEFEAGADGMVAEITAGSLRVGAPGWLQKPIRGERLTGVLTALTSAEDIRVGFDGVGLTTPAGRISAQGRLLVPRSGERPDLSVLLSVDQARIASVRSLIARRALPEPVWRWLESAIPTGDIHDARLTFHGLLSKAPPEGREPVLAVTAQLAVPVFGYARGWPAANDVSAVVRVDGTRLDTRIVSGRILGADVREARIVIDDLAAEIPVLEVAGNVEGTSADAARFLAESPLRDRFRPLLDSLLCPRRQRPRSPSSPPAEGPEPSRGGSRAGSPSTTTGSTSRGLRLGLEAVNGVVTFRNASIRSDGMTATWLGEPLVAAIGTAPKSQGMTRVSIDGRLTPHLLSALLRDIGPADAPPERFSGLLARIEGSAAWSAVLDFPRPGAGRPVRVRAATDLGGHRPRSPRASRQGERNHAPAQRGQPHCARHRMRHRRSLRRPRGRGTAARFGRRAVAAGSRHGGVRCRRGAALRHARTVRGRRGADVRCRRVVRIPARPEVRRCIPNEGIAPSRRARRVDRRRIDLCDGHTIPGHAAPGVAGRGRWMAARSGGAGSRRHRAHPPRSLRRARGGRIRTLRARSRCLRIREREAPPRPSVPAGPVVLVPAIHPRRTRSRSGDLRDGADRAGNGPRTARCPGRILQRPRERKLDPDRRRTSHRVRP